MIVAVIILAVLVVALAGLVIWILVRPKTDGDGSLTMMSEINKSMESLRDGLQKQMSEQAGLTNKQMQAQHAQNMKIVQEVTRQLTGIERTNKSVGDVAAELKTLQNVLQNPKQRGVLGEYYLDQILKNLLPLYSGATSKDRAGRLLELMKRQRTFSPSWPVPSVPVNSAYFNPYKYWQGPTWVNTNWLIVDGLQRNGFEAEAEVLKKRTLEMVSKSGMSEYFNPLNAKPAGAPNFSWTAALTIDLIKA